MARENISEYFNATRCDGDPVEEARDDFPYGSRGKFHISRDVVRVNAGSTANPNGRPAPSQSTRSQTGAHGNPIIRR